MPRAEDKILSLIAAFLILLLSLAIPASGQLVRLEHLNATVIASGESSHLLMRFDVLGLRNQSVVPAITLKLSRNEMGLLGKLLGERKSPLPPDRIRCYDSFGREVYYEIRREKDCLLLILYPIEAINRGERRSYYLDIESDALIDRGLLFDQIVLDLAIAPSPRSARIDLSKPRYLFVTYSNLDEDLESWVENPSRIRIEAELTPIILPRFPFRISYLYWLLIVILALLWLFYRRVAIISIGILEKGNNGSHLLSIENIGKTPTKVILKSSSMGRKIFGGKLEPGKSVLIKIDDLDDWIEIYDRYGTLKRRVHAGSLKKRDEGEARSKSPDLDRIHPEP